MYFQNNILHRINSSAIIWYIKNSKIKEMYFQNGKIHRLDGPAIIWYHNDGLVNNTSYYLNGKIVSKEQLIKAEINPNSFPFSKNEMTKLKLIFE